MISFCLYLNSFWLKFINFFKKSVKISRWKCIFLNGQKQQDKRTNNVLQEQHEPHKTQINSAAPEGPTVPAPLSDTRRVTVKRQERHVICKSC